LPDTASVGAGAFGDQDELLALAEEAARIGIWDIELETGLLRARPQFFRIMGLEPTDQPIPIETTRRLRHPQDRERVLLAMQDAAVIVRYWAARFAYFREEGPVDLAEKSDQGFFKRKPAEPEDLARIFHPPP